MNKNNIIFRRLKVKNAEKVQSALEIVAKKDLSLEEVTALLEVFELRNVATSDKTPLFSLQDEVNCYESGYKSRSEAELAFCEFLAQMVGEDVELIDTIFRHSKLMREKWDRKESGGTYGENIIKKAISNVRK